MTARMFVPDDPLATQPSTPQMQLAEEVAEQLPDAIDLNVEVGEDGFLMLTAEVRMQATLHVPDLAVVASEFEPAAQGRLLGMRMIHDLKQGLAARLDTRKR